MKKKLVSIIVPVYKTPLKYLEICIESLVHQSYRDIEIILIDDGSPDNCGVICDNYAEKYSSIRVIHKKNEGVSVARNIGIEEAKGEYIMFVDADDWLASDCVEMATEEIISKDVDILVFKKYNVYGDKVVYQKDSGNASHYIRNNFFRTIQFITITEQVNKLNFPPLSPWGKILKRDICINNKITFPKGLKRSQDVIFNLHIWEFVQSAYFYDYYGYYYRIHGKSNVHRYQADISDVLIKIIQQCEVFINLFHSDDKEYIQKLGYRAIKQLTFIENCYTCHPETKLSRKEIISYSRKYLDTPIVKKYISQTSIKDCDSVKFLFRYLITKLRLFEIYYLFCKYIKRKYLQKLNS